jgi:cardiolipin synthase
VWLAAVIFGRDMSLGIAAIYYRYASLPTPKTFMRYWDFSIPSAEVHPTNVSKWNTFLQLGLIGATTTLPLLTENVLPGALAAIDFEAAVKGMQYVVAGTTLWSGASYLWTKDAVRILGTNEELKRKQGIRGRMVLGVSFAAFLALAVELRRRETNGAANEAENRRET